MPSLYFCSALLGLTSSGGIGLNLIRSLILWALIIWALTGCSAFLTPMEENRINTHIYWDRPSPADNMCMGPYA